MNLVAAIGKINNMVKEGWVFKVEYSSEHPRYVAMLEREDEVIEHRDYGIIRAIEGLARENEIRKIT